MDFSKRRSEDCPNPIQFPRSGNWGCPDYHLGKENNSQDWRANEGINAGDSRVVTRLKPEAFSQVGI